MPTFSQTFAFLLSYVISESVRWGWAVLLLGISQQEIWSFRNSASVTHHSTFCEHTQVYSESGC